jgi:diguanylate cyclase (GGDEF)-like protein/PAS domain S-box-containing protein
MDSIVPELPPNVPPPRMQRAMAWLVSLGQTIRGRILIAFLVMSVITGALGGYASLDIMRAGILVAKTFDESLMSINYARAAAADFATMQAVFARRIVATDPALRHKLDEKLQALEQSLTDDLTIAAERSQSARAAQAAANVQRAVKAWTDVRQHLLDGTEPGAAWEALDHYAATVDQQVDLLINYTAGDGFTYRQRARTAVADDMRLNLIGTALALLLSALVAWLLARRIIRPVAMASAVAERIARGDLEGTVPKGSADELGALLASMGVMRDNIRAMMAREVQQRQLAQTRLADALESSREGIVVVDAERRIALANSQAADFLGSSSATLQPGLPVAELATAVAESQDGGVTRLLLDGDVSMVDETRLPDGRWLRVSRSATRDGGFVVVCSDISLLKEQEARLQATNLRLDAALENMSQGLSMYDAENRLQVVNRRFCEIFSLQPDKIVPGMTFRDVLTESIAAGNHQGKSVSDLIAERASFLSQRMTGTYFQELDQGLVIAITSQPTADGGWVATYEDVTERRQAEERIAFMARHDALTGLPNRVLFSERIEQALAQLGRNAGGFAVIFLDLDNFKQVNDTLGHPIGDRLLCAAAERLQACVREVDTVARLGGDEFAIVQNGVKLPEDTAILARRIVEVVSAPYELDGHRVTVGISVGISVAPGDGTAVAKLLKNADVALYRAKTDGRGTWRFFEAEMDARLQARRMLELDLREALGKNELDLFYQPLYDLDRNLISGFEALLRWRHPKRGFVSPAEFIPVAEEIGLIDTLGEWVLHRACSEAMNWPTSVKVAVNVSPAQFKTTRLVPAVTQALEASGFPAERLELEITESVLLANSGATLATLHALRKLGLRFSLDDFGTGYSSLSYLRSFPFDKIKIDQSFIRDVAATDGASTIVRAIIDLSRSLGMRSTAEGVETEEQLARLRMEGCNEVQGYLFSRPVPAREVPGLLERWGAPAVIEKKQRVRRGVR